jgi:hypothetical protein
MVSVAVGVERQVFGYVCVSMLKFGQKSSIGQIKAM